MGFNDEYSGRIILDLETAPIGDAATYIEPVSAPGNYKDPVKIEAYCREKQAEKVDKAALDPDLCRIVALGWMDEDGGEPSIYFGKDDHSEATALMLFWQALASKIIIGFHVVGFDVPVLLRRSLYLGVKVPRLQLEKYRHPQVIDLMLELSFNHLIDDHTLDFYSKRFGLDVPTDAYTGADIPGLIVAGDWGAVHAHLTADLYKTAALAERLGYFKRVEAAVL